MITFKNQRQMIDWLAVNKIEYSKWGQGQSKSLENLWHEYVSGESCFEDDPPKRIVAVVRIIISRGEKILVEAEQEFMDGRRRVRNRPPSDKIKPGEDVHEAALRCLDEELGLIPKQITIEHGLYKKKVTTVDSPSYPGLLCRYTVHLLKAAVTGLPDEPFWHENTAAAEGDPIKRHLWQWVEREK